jgi:type III secretory pathway lipoprotein EscJ
MNSVSFEVQRKRSKIPKFVVNGVEGLYEHLSIIANVHEDDEPIE